MQLDSLAGASIDLSARASFTGATIVMSQDGQVLSSTTGVTLTEGSQSTIDILVVNKYVQLQYELVLIRPLPICTDDQLSQWYSTAQLNML